MSSRDCGKTRSRYKKQPQGRKPAPISGSFYAALKRPSSTALHAFVSFSQPLLVVQDNAQKRTVDQYLTVVIDQTKLSETVHEEVDSRARGTNHLCQSFLTYVRDHFLRFVFPEVGQQKQSSRQPPFAGVEELIDQVFLGAAVAHNQVSHKNIGELMLCVQGAQHLLLLDLEDGTRRCGGGSG